MLGKKITNDNALKLKNIVSNVNKVITAILIVIGLYGLLLIINLVDFLTKLVPIDSIVGILPSDFQSFINTTIIPFFNSHGIIASSVPVIVDGIIIFILLALYFYFKNIKKEKLSFDGTCYDNLEGQLRRIKEFQGSDINISEKDQQLILINVDINEEKDKQLNSFSNVKSSINEALVVFKESIPEYNTIHEVDKFKKQWEIACNELKNALKFFNLNIEKEFDKLRKEPNYTAKGFDDTTVNLTIIDDLAKLIKIDNTVISFMSKYYKGDNLSVLWKEIQNNNNHLTVISNILYNSKKVDFDKRKTSIEEFITILKSTDSFDISTISSNVILYQRVIEYIYNYRQRVISERIPLINTFSNEDIVRNINYKKTFEEEFLKLLSEELLKNINNENKESYRNAILAILLNNDLTFKAIVCKNASNDETVIIIMAYHELLQKKQEENKNFYLIDLLMDTSIINLIKDNISNDPEYFSRFHYFQDKLSRGEWYDSGILLLKTMIEERDKALSKKTRKSREI